VDNNTSDSSIPADLVVRGRLIATLTHTLTQEHGIARHAQLHSTHARTHVTHAHTHKLMHPRACWCEGEMLILCLYCKTNFPLGDFFCLAEYKKTQRSAKQNTDYCHTHQITNTDTPYVTLSHTHIHTHTHTNDYTSALVLLPVPSPPPLPPAPPATES